MTKSVIHRKLVVEQRLSRKISKMVKPKNVILIGIDSLRVDRTPMGGYEYKSCPTLEWLAINGIYCKQAVTHSGPTQFALPSVFTSTLPLDFGGYDDGIKNRPVSLPEIFKQYGFKTSGFHMDSWSSDLGGYSRGFDEIGNLFEIDKLWSNAGLYFEYYQRIWDNGLIDDSEFHSLVKSRLRKTMELTVSFCIKEKQEVNLADSKYDDIYKYDFNLMAAIINEEMEKLEDNPRKYIQKHIGNLSNLEYFLKGKKLRTYKTGAFGIFEKLSFNKLSVTYLKKCLYKNFVSAEYLVNRANKWMAENGQQPFFLWLFFDDIHENNCTTGKGKAYRKNINRYLRTIGRKERLSLRSRLIGHSFRDLDPMYDASVKYLDNNIRLLVSFLKKKGLFENTLLVIFSDHGTGIGSHNHHGPDLTATFYEEYVRVPLIFYNPEINPISIKSQIGLIDIGPTILDLMKIPKPDSFKGVPIYSQKATRRRYMLMENMFKGPCDIDRKPINIAIRTKEYKYIYREYISNAKDILRELYDIKRDPKERTNLAGTKGYEKIKERFERIATKRCQDIRKQNRAIKDNKR